MREGGRRAGRRGCPCRLRWLKQGAEAAATRVPGRRSRAVKGHARFSWWLLLPAPRPPLSPSPTRQPCPCCLQSNSGPPRLWEWASSTPSTCSSCSSIWVGGTVAARELREVRQGLGRGSAFYAPYLPWVRQPSSSRAAQGGESACAAYAVSALGQHAWGCSRSPTGANCRHGSCARLERCCRHDAAAAGKQGGQWAVHRLCQHRGGLCRAGHTHHWLAARQEGQWVTYPSLAAYHAVGSFHSCCARHHAPATQPRSSTDAPPPAATDSTPPFLSPYLMPSPLPSATPTPPPGLRHHPGHHQRPQYGQQHPAGGAQPAGPGADHHHLDDRPLLHVLKVGEGCHGDSALIEGTACNARVSVKPSRPAAACTFWRCSAEALGRLSRALAPDLVLGSGFRRVGMQSWPAWPRCSCSLTPALLPRPTAAILPSSGTSLVSIISASWWRQTTSSTVCSACCRCARRRGVIDSTLAGRWWRQRAEGGGWVPATAGSASRWCAWPGLISVLNPSAACAGAGVVWMRGGQGASVPRDPTPRFETTGRVDWAGPSPLPAWAFSPLLHLDPAFREAPLQYPFPCPGLHPLPAWASSPLLHLDPAFGEAPLQYPLPCASSLPCHAMSCV